MLNSILKVILILGFTIFPPVEKIKIHMIGDSTMSDKKQPVINPEHGWGQVLPIFFNDSVSVINYAVNGRSTKSFIDEGRWANVLEAIKPGDYVFIQFGHNDQKFKDPKRFTNPYTGYRKNLRKFVLEAREHGAIPVLFTSIVRRNFNEFGVLEDTHGAYPEVVRKVAKQLEAPLVDLQLKSETLVLELGEESSKELYLWLAPGESEMHPDGKQDNTHFTKKGAMEMARLAVAGLRENNLPISKYIKK